MSGFPHKSQNVIRYMFRGDLQLSADMISYQFIYKVITIWILKDVIKSDSASYKDFLNTFYSSKFSEQLDIICMICFKIRTRFLSKALPVLTHTVFKLLLT